MDDERKRLNFSHLMIFNNSLTEFTVFSLIGSSLNKFQVQFPLRATDKISFNFHTAVPERRMERHENMVLCSPQMAVAENEKRHKKMSASS